MVEAGVHVTVYMGRFFIVKYYENWEILNPELDKEALYE